jgi:hypothetical protein
MACHTGVVAACRTAARSSNQSSAKPSWVMVRTGAPIKQLGLVQGNGASERPYGTIRG